MAGILEAVARWSSPHHENLAGRCPRSICDSDLSIELKLFYDVMAAAMNVDNERHGKMPLYWWSIIDKCVGFPNKGFAIRTFRENRRSLLALHPTQTS
jgi:hypothetical protein